MTSPPPLEDSLDEAFESLRRARRDIGGKLELKETGRVLSVSTGVAQVSGLPHVGFEELLICPDGLYGIAFNLDADRVGVVLLGEAHHLQAGDEVQRTGRVMDVPVGEGLLGRIVNPLGQPLDEGGPLNFQTRLPVERPARPIMDRAAVTTPLQTGIKVVDAVIPVGRGQRELILGDRQTGKTTIAVDTVLNQRGEDVICVYCAIGQRASAVAQTVAKLREHGALDYTVVVVTEGNEAPGLQFIAPFAATSIAEYFMEQGRDVVVVYDDLTQHARAYRELSLLLRRPPGREAFPGDIFYLHSRLLERSTRLKEELGGGSLSALPIIETEAQNMSAYIPTNLISITDGQLYLSPSLFALGVLPAVDVGRSVSRVGGKAQLSAYRAVAGDLKLVYSQFQELESFARFGARLDDRTRKVIEHGRRVRAILKQGESDPIPVVEQIAVLWALKKDLFDEIPLDRVPEAELLVRKASSELSEELQERIIGDAKLTEADLETLHRTARSALEPMTETEPEADDESTEAVQTQEPEEPKETPESEAPQEPEESDAAEPTEEAAQGDEAKKV